MEREKGATKKKANMRKGRKGGVEYIWPRVEIPNTQLIAGQTN